MSPTRIDFIGRAMIWNVVNPNNGLTVAVYQYLNHDNPTAWIRVQPNYSEYVYRGHLTVGEWSPELQSAVESKMYHWSDQYLG